MSSSETSSTSSPELFILPPISTQCDLGTGAGLVGGVKLYNSALACLPIVNKSLKPRLVTYIVLDSFFSSTAFVATVVPCMIKISSRRTPRAERPFIIAISGLLGVDNSL